MDRYNVPLCFLDLKQPARTARQLSHHVVSSCLFVWTVIVHHRLIIHKVVARHTSLCIYNHPMAGTQNVSSMQEKARCSFCCGFTALLRASSGGTCISRLISHRAKAFQHWSLWLLFHAFMIFYQFLIADYIEDNE
jgi:hypothetical protein